MKNIKSKINETCLLFLHKQTKTKKCFNTMLKTGKPLENLFQTFNDGYITFSGLRNIPFNKFDNSKNDSLNQK